MHQDFLRNLNNEKQAKKKIVKGMYPNEFIRGILISGVIYVFFRFRL